MLPKQSYIGSLLVLLISVSLSLSTAHFHKSVEHQATPETEMGTTISVDTNYCPICGYLFKAGNTSSIQPVVALEAFEELAADIVAQYHAPSISRASSRAPPFLA